MSHLTVPIREQGRSTDARPRWPVSRFNILFAMIKKPCETDCPQQDRHGN